MLHNLTKHSRIYLTKFMRCIMDFLMNLHGPILYIIIFLAKIIEVSIATIRLVYINKGERVIGAILAFVEIIIWLIVVSSVLNNISEDPLKMFVYAIAFSLGNYIGITIESKIAVGLASIQVVVNEDTGKMLAEILREESYGVTIIDGRGKNDSKKSLLFIQLKRKKISDAVKLIKQTAPTAYITINDIKSMVGGYLK
ncbi:MAG TPA: hypothetical protein DHU59_12620 [Clostridiales bacterium]|nr:hypothetical protein [Clostridiales bacterium]